MSDTPPMPPPLPTPVDPDAPPESAEPLDVAVRLEVAARVAGALGITALALLMVAPCSCGGSMLVGGVLGAGAAWAGMRARGDEPSPGGRVWATTAMICGGLAAVILLLVAAAVGLSLIGQVLGILQAFEQTRDLI